MHSIRIIDVPPGGAPLEIREKWVGLVLPLVLYEAQGVEQASQDVVSGEARKYRGFSVDSVLAIEILDLHHPDAAKWWRESTRSTHFLNKLIFNATACEVVETMPSVMRQGKADEETITVGGFIDLLQQVAAKKVEFSFETWNETDIQMLEDFCSAEIWAELLGVKLTRAIIMLLAVTTAACYRKVLEDCTLRELRRDLALNGHAQLQILHQIAGENGFPMELSEIDRPLSEDEEMPHLGYGEYSTN